MAPPPYLPELAPYAATCPIPSVWVDRSYYEFVDVAAGRTFAVETKHWDPADPDGRLDQAVQKLGGYSPSAPAVYPHAHCRMRGTALPSRAPNTEPELRVVTMAWENQFRVVSVTGACSEQALIELVAGWAPAPTAPSVDDQAKFWSRPTWNALPLSRLVMGLTPLEYAATQSGLRGPLELLPSNDYRNIFVRMILDGLATDNREVSTGTSLTRFSDIYDVCLLDEAPGVVPKLGWVEDFFNTEVSAEDLARLKVNIEKARAFHRRFGSGDNAHPSRSRWWGRPSARTRSSTWSTTASCCRSTVPCRTSRATERCLSRVQSSNTLGLL